MSVKTTRIKTVQAQYYSYMDDMEWVGINLGKTKLEARKAIKEHCQRYKTTPAKRKFRIVTTVTSTRIEEIV